MAGGDSLLKLSRYARRRDYRWSSYRGYTGADKPFDWIAYGPMLEKYAGLTRRACAPWLGMTSGMGVGYQIRLAMSAIKRDPELKRQIEKLESFFGKESGS